MTGIVELYNQALTACGAENLISSPTENSREREICDLWYSTVRDHILRSAFWPSAKGYKRLALLAERDSNVDWVSTDPAPGYAFAYAVPADYLAPRFLTSYARFEETITSGQKSIVTNVEQAILVYTFRQTNIELWDISLRMAITYGLAAFICMPLTGKAERSRDNRDAANNLILTAQVQSANTDENTFDSVPDWIQARGYADTSSRQRFIYPMGPNISMLELSSVS